MSVGVPFKERSEIDKLRFAMLHLTRLALEGNDNLDVHILSLGSSLGFVAMVELCDALNETRK